MGKKKLTLHFTEDEMKCPDCDQLIIDSGFMSMLEDARVVYGRPMQVTSGYRCRCYNKQVGGVPNSTHTKGLAADITCLTGKDRFEMINAFLKAGFKRIGIGKYFIHVDAGDLLSKTWKYPHGVIWTYYKYKHAA